MVFQVFLAIWGILGYFEIFWGILGYFRYYLAGTSKVENEPTDKTMMEKEDRKGSRQEG